VKHSLAVILLNAWTGCCAVALSQQTRLLLGEPLAFGPLEGFVFGGALFAYNIIRRDALPRTLAWMFGAVGLLCLVLLPYFTQCAAVVPFVVWGLYYGANGLIDLRLRTVPLLKPVTVALVWSWVTVLLPLSSGQWTTAAVLFAGRMAFLFGLSLACDLCDWEIDTRHGLDTLALRLGRARAMRVIDTALVVSAACVLTNYALGYYGISASVALLTSLALAAIGVRLILRFASGRQTQKAFIDGLMFLQFVVVWLQFAATHPTHP
jgi:4-hydroxybenzoate polyprenyltransferase